MIARVRPITRTRALRGVFDYALRGDQTNVAVGSVLRVPFNNTRMLGVVVELAGDSALPLERLAEPDEVLEPGLPADLVALAEWMAREYCSTPARALSLVLAPGSGSRVKPKLTLVAELTSAGRAALDDPAVILNERQRTAMQLTARAWCLGGRPESGRPRFGGSRVVDLSQSSAAAFDDGPSRTASEVRAPRPRR